MRESEVLLWIQMTTARLSCPSQEHCLLWGLTFMQVWHQAPFRDFHHIRYIVSIQQMHKKHLYGLKCSLSTWFNVRWVESLCISLLIILIKGLLGWTLNAFWNKRLCPCLQRAENHEINWNGNLSMYNINLIPLSPLEKKKTQTKLNIKQFQRYIKWRFPEYAAQIVNLI